jgi:catechol-2,3-dioxygenase
MARIRHIALTTNEPVKAAEFYKTAFGLKELRRNNGNVFLTDGYIHVAVLKTKGEEAPDMGPMVRTSPAFIISASRWTISTRQAGNWRRRTVIG